MLGEIHDHLTLILHFGTTWETFTPLTTSRRRLKVQETFQKIKIKREMYSHPLSVKCSLWMTVTAHTWWCLLGNKSQGPAYMLHSFNSLNPGNNTFRKLQHRKVTELAQGHTAKKKRKKEKRRRRKRDGARVGTQAAWPQSPCLQSPHETVFHYILSSAYKAVGCHPWLSEENDFLVKITLPPEDISSGI